MCFSPQAAITRFSPVSGHHVRNGGDCCQRELLRRIRAAIERLNEFQRNARAAKIAFGYVASYGKPQRPQRRTESSCLRYGDRLRQRQSQCLAERNLVVGGNAVVDRDDQLYPARMQLFSPRRRTCRILRCGDAEYNTPPSRPLLEALYQHRSGANAIRVINRQRRKSARLVYRLA